MKLSECNGFNQVAEKKEILVRDPNGNLNNVSHGYNAALDSLGAACVVVDRNALENVIVEAYEVRLIASALINSMDKWLKLERGSV